MSSEIKQVLDELKEIREDLDYIKKRVVDGDLILTLDDLQSLEEAEKDFKQRKTKKLV